MKRKKLLFLRDSNEIHLPRNKIYQSLTMIQNYPINIIIEIELTETQKIIRNIE